MSVSTKSGVFVYNDKEFPFEFKTSLSAGDKLRFTESVLNSLIVDNIYCYVIKDLIFDFKIAEYFALIKLEDVIEGQDEGSIGIPAVEEFIENSNIADIIKENAEYGVLEELQKAIDLNIAYSTGIQINPVSEALADLINTVEKKISMVDMEEIMGAAQAIGNVPGEFTMDKLIEAYGKSDLFKQTVSGERDNVNAGKFKLVEKQNNNEQDDKPDSNEE